MPAQKQGNSSLPKLRDFLPKVRVGDVREPGGWGFRPQLVKLWFHGPHHCIPGLTSILNKMFIG